MGKLAYILGARENMAVIQIQATPPLLPQALSDAAMTALLNKIFFPATITDPYCVPACCYSISTTVEMGGGKNPS